MHLPLSATVLATPHVTEVLVVVLLADADWIGIFPLHNTLSARRHAFTVISVRVHLLGGSSEVPCFQAVTFSTHTMDTN